MHPIKILLAAANPTDTSQLRLGEEAREIEAKIRAGKHRDSFEVRSVWALRPDDLLQQLNEFGPQVVHFSGHGANSGEILLEDERGATRPLPPEALAALFDAFDGTVQIVFLNACYSDVRADALMNAVDVVIGMNKPIGDRAAIVFASSVYRALAFGKSVDESYRQGLAALTIEGIDGADTPVVRSREGIDLGKVVLVGEFTTAAAARRSRDPAVPERLRKMLQDGTALIAIGSGTTRDTDDSSLVFLELALRNSATTFVVEADRRCTIIDVAAQSAERLLGQVNADDYDWTLVYEDKVLDDFLTLEMAGIPSGDRVLLVGNHRRPEWAPSG